MSDKETIYRKQDITGSHFPFGQATAINIISYLPRAPKWGMDDYRMM